MVCANMATYGKASTHTPPMSPPNHNIATDVVLKLLVCATLVSACVYSAILACDLPPLAQYTRRVRSRVPSL